MQTIEITSCTSSGLKPAFDAVQQIDIEDGSFASGAFGAIYHCVAIDGKAPLDKLAVKIFQDDGSKSDERAAATIRKLQEKIVSYNSGLRQKKEKTVEQVTALYALPQLSFEGRLANKRVSGYISMLLEQPGWAQFSDILNGKGKLNGFYQIPLLTRLQFAFDLAEAFYHLAAMGFIYADLNPQNFFVNQSEARLCLIDFDGGAIDAEPETFGKMGEWLAPEIQGQLTANQRVIKVTPESDRWSVMVGIHFMLFHFHPLFYLATRSNRTMPDYFSSYRWPAYDESDTNFNPDAKAYYAKYLADLRTAVAPSLCKLFDTSINKGHDNPLQRPAYLTWMRAIGALLEAPVIEIFAPDRNVVLNSVPVTIHWKVHKALAVFIDGVEVSDTGSLDFLPEKNTSYRLKAVGRFGEAEKAAHVSVLPLPVLETLRVPVPPFEKSIILSDIQVSRPQVTISLQGLNLNFFPKTTGFAPAMPPGKNAATRAAGQNALPVSSIFDRLKVSFTKIINSL